MADKKISGLPVAGALTGTEPVPIVQGGATKKTTVQDIADLAGGVQGVTGNIVDNTDPLNPIVTGVYTKDSNGNVFYNGVSATLGTGCLNNTFQQGASNNTLGNGCIANIFELYCSGNIIGINSVTTVFQTGSGYNTIGESCQSNVFGVDTTGFIFGDTLKNVTIQNGVTGADYTDLGDYGFMYGNDFPATIFSDGTDNYWSYYDVANDRIELRNLTTLAVSYIGGSGIASVSSGTNINVDNTDPLNPIINSLSDRYKTTSTSSNSIGNGSKTFTVDANLSYIPLQEVLIVFNPSNHMHGEVTSYSGTSLVVDVKRHTGSGTYTSWVINLDGTPVDAITGTGAANRLAYFTAEQVIDDAAAITAARALISDANGIPTHSAVTSTELGYVSGVTSAIQTQLNGKEPTITTLPISKGGTNSGTTLNNNRVMQSSSGAIVEAAAIIGARALKSDANGIPTHFDTATEPSLTELSYVKGVTSAIQTQLNAKQKYIKKAGDGTGVTGTTSNTYCNGVLVPANTYTAGDVIVIDVRTYKTGTAGTIITRIYANTTNNLSGSPILIGTGLTQVASTRSYANMRMIGVEVAAGTGNGTTAQNTTFATASDYSASTSAISNLAIDWTVDQYIVIAIQLGSSADTGNCNLITLG